MGTGVTGLTPPPDQDRLVPAAATSRIMHWGFLAHSDLPDGPGPAFLLVAMRRAPTLMHFDPEAVDYWVTDQGRGERRSLTYGTPMPQSEDFAWGSIRLVDRLGISNEYLTFGGHLDAASLDHVVVAAFVSPAPLVRLGGHSQGVDLGADEVGAFFGRLMVAVDYVPGFETEFAKADPLTRYAAFVRDEMARRGRRAGAGPTDDDLTRLLRHEDVRLRSEAPDAWEGAGGLLASAGAD